MGSERDRAIADAVRKACADLCARVRCRTWDADECALQIRDDKQVDLDAIIAAVTAQHPAPALPREVAMRVAEASAEIGYSSGWTEGTGENAPRLSGPVLTDKQLAAIVALHVPTDEEREAERAVVEAALAMRHTFPAGREWTPTEIALYNAAAHLLAIRAKRGAR